MNSNLNNIIIIQKKIKIKYKSLINIIFFFFKKEVGKKYNNKIKILYILMNLILFEMIIVVNLIEFCL